MKIINNTYSFIGVSTALPTTSYVKMIDIWMIFTMTFPLLEVSLHTYRETVNMKLRKLAAASHSTSLTKIKVSPIQNSYTIKLTKPEEQR